MPPKVLVTGASGLLGNQVVRLLLQRNFDVVAMLRTNSNAEILKGLNCTIQRGSLSKYEDIEKALDSCDYVVHAASRTVQDSTSVENYTEANITSTKVLVKACMKSGIKKFILVSSANCFTNGSRKNPGNEKSGFMEYLKHSGYAYSKYLAQKYVLKKVASKNFPAIIVAPTFMIGPYDVKPSSGQLLLYILKNKVLFYPQGGKNFVDVHVVAEAIANALSQGKKGECYLLSGVNLSYKEYFQKVSKLTGERKILIPIPKGITGALNLLYKLFPSNKLLLLKTNVRMLFSDNYFSNAKAKKELSMPDTNLDSATNQSIDWFKQQKYY